jgi:NADH-quinone oxidoreductase subunit M
MTLLATTGVILSACYMLWAIQRVLFNPLDRPENRHLTDVNWREAGMLVPLSLLILVVGVYPDPILRRMEPSLTRLVQQVQAGASAPTVAADAGRR